MTRGRRKPAAAEQGSPATPAAAQATGGEAGRADGGPPPQRRPPSRAKAVASGTAETAAVAATPRPKRGKRGATAEAPLLDLLTAATDPPPQTTAAPSDAATMAGDAGTGSVAVAHAAPHATAGEPAAEERAELPVQAGPAPRYPRRLPAEPVAARRSPPAPLPAATLRHTAVSEAPVRRALDMASLAERQRQIREAARLGDRTDAPRPADASGPTAPPTATLSMQERAMRYRASQPEAPAARDAAAAPDTSLQVPAAAEIGAVGGAAPTASAPTSPAARGIADGLSRAMEARRSPVAESPGGVATPATAAVAQGGVALVLVARNHAAVVQSQLQAWRNALPQAEVQWLLLDLGSTDDTVALASTTPALRVLHAPGGLVRPRATLAHVMRETAADVVVLADLAAMATTAASALIQAVRGGAALACSPQHAPALLAVSRPQWLRTATPPTDLQHWAASHGGAKLIGAVHGMYDRSSLVQRLMAGRADRWLGRLPATLQAPVSRWLGMLPRRA